VTKIPNHKLCRHGIPVDDFCATCDNEMLEHSVFINDPPSEKELRDHGFDFGDDDLNDED
jgi:hypothetical protein